jgi:hypothetical protein
MQIDTRRIEELTIEQAQEGGYLCVTGHGAATLREFFLAIDVIALTVATQGNKRVLIDLLGVRQALSFSDHLMLGARVAERLASAERIATVVPTQYRSGSSEKAAQKSGLALQAFVTPSDALAWLLAD